MSELLTPAARPDPRRGDPGCYATTRRVNFRIGDVDQFGHVNNVALQQLHQEARTGLFDLLWPPVQGVRPVTTIAVQHVTHFLDEAFYPGEADCLAAVGRVGASSFTLATLVASIDGRPLTVADTVFVVREHGSIAGLSSEHRALLGRYLLRS